MSHDAQVVESTYPVSPLQHGMLFEALYSPGAGVDLLQVVGVLQEALEVPVLEHAWRKIVSCQAVLRTTFLVQASAEPVQRIHAAIDLPFSNQDWRHLTPHEQARRFEQFLRDDRQAGFDFAEGPLLRLNVFRFGDADFRLVWSVPHAIIDGPSCRMVLEEVFRLYEALRRGEPCDLPTRRPFADHVAWLRQLDLGVAERFFRTLLMGFKVSTPFIVDEPRASKEAAEQVVGEHAEAVRRLPFDLSDALRDLAARLQVSLSTVVQAAWAVLLSRYSGEDDVVFGAVRACRGSGLEGSRSMIGLFINTLPLRVRLPGETGVAGWLQELRAQQRTLRNHEHTPLVSVLGWSEVPRGTPLFQSLVLYDHTFFDTPLRAKGGPWLGRRFWIRERTGFPINLYAYGEPQVLLKISYDVDRFRAPVVTRMLGHLESILAGIVRGPDHRLRDLPLLTDEEHDDLLVGRNQTSCAYDERACIHGVFERQADRTPEHIAVVAESGQLTYRELDARANQVAHYLRRQGVRPNVPVGIFVERGLELMVGLLGILKAGGAYVPLDPSYPRDRVAFMLEDSAAPVVLTLQRLRSRLPTSTATIAALDADWQTIARDPATRATSGVSSRDLAYVIYTSGSTGRPKGVMLEHRSVVNFFAGMDRVIGERPGVWLATTSISFDISVLELFYALARGFRVIIHSDRDVPAQTAARRPSTRPTDFSLFYFASDDRQDPKDKYRLLLDGVRFADANGFSAVWTPERHFHPFGGLYPNPSVTGAALAAITKHVKIRAGSVVLPLQHPLRVAEEWSLVDNLSHGRVGVSFASGWHANDFVLAPDAYASRRELMLRQIDIVKRLWRGEAMRFKDGLGNDVDVTIFPRPVQPDLPIWLTAAGSPETFRSAGEIGAGVLTHLLGQSLDELTSKLGIYREAWRAHHDGPSDGHVTLMLHAFVGPDTDAVRDRVREPFLNYLKSSSDLVRKLAEGLLGKDSRPTEADMEELWRRAFERFFETSGLFGTPASCLRTIRSLKDIGVDEVACLVDFGVDTDSVLESLSLLAAVKDQAAARSSSGFDSVATLIRRHGVTHMQCTPSLARLVLLTPGGAEALASLDTLVLGGEALPLSLVEELGRRSPRCLLNMYGPTETCIWSTTDEVRPEEGVVTIGRPIANTQVYVLDSLMRPLPAAAIGELFIGGAGVARGYLNQPELTAERFVPSPFNGSESCLYRSGDLVRYREDGRLEFLGRDDQQVKLRGFRVELGEIEAVLRGHPAVRDVVVGVRQDRPVDSQLVAYVVAGSQGEARSTALHSFAEARLPDYMVPGVFVTIDNLPLTPNGKVDRKALAAVALPHARTTETFVAPRTPVERALAGLWSDVLSVPRIGVNDNFFEVGGNSLSAVQIAFRTRQVLGIDVALPTFFRHPTIGALAGEVETGLMAKADRPDLESLLSEVEQLSEEQARALLTPVRPARSEAP